MLFRPSLAMYRVSRLVQGIAGPLSSQALSQRTLSLLSATKSISCKSTFNNQALSIFSKYQVSRFYGAAAHLDVKEVEERVLEVLCAFDRVDAKKVTKMSSFTADLGLDSLDAVEIVMALEDEFAIEIPDADAEKIQSTDEAIKYIAAHPHAK